MKKTMVGPMGKKLIAAFVLASCTVWNAFCTSLSFHVIQHNESLTDVCESALVIEDAILNYFFDAGYIVTNLPACVSKSEEQDKKFYQNGYNDAASGSFDDFVQIKLYFTGTEEENAKVALGNMKKISWKIVNTATGKVLEEGNQNVTVDVAVDSEKNVREFAKEFALHLNKVLGKRA